MLLEIRTSFTLVGEYHASHNSLDVVSSQCNAQRSMNSDRYMTRLFRRLSLTKIPNCSEFWSCTGSIAVSLFLPDGSYAAPSALVSISLGGERGMGDRPLQALMAAYVQQHRIWRERLVLSPL